MPKKITLLSGRYKGRDGDRTLSLVEGDTVEVSDEKHAQIARDFPHLFDLGTTKRPAARKATGKKNDDDAPAAGDEE